MSFEHFSRLVLKATQHGTVKGPDERIKSGHVTCVCASYFVFNIHVLYIHVCVYVCMSKLQHVPLL